MDFNSNLKFNKNLIKRKKSFEFKERQINLQITNYYLLVEIKNSN